MKRIKFYIYELIPNYGPSKGVKHYWSRYGWALKIQDAIPYGPATQPEANGGWQVGGPSCFTNRIEINL